jgi:hypothetical protein
MFIVHATISSLGSCDDRQVVWYDMSDSVSTESSMVECVCHCIECGAG